jgi:uncharacterized delta-60 repeat protein
LTPQVKSYILGFTDLTGGFYLLRNLDMVLLRLKKLFSSFPALTLIGILLSACGGGGVDNVSPVEETPGLTITIKPSTASLRTGETQFFSATVTGADTNAVLWHVEEGVPGGTIDANGLYLAPSVAGTYHVTVASPADISKTATAVVTVTTGNVVILPPPSPVEIVSTSPGSLDATFGKGGIVAASPGFGSDSASAIILQRLQQGEKTIVVGRAFNGADNDFLLIRYNVDGTPDINFGSGGRVLTDFGGDDGARAAVLDQSGRIVVAGYAFNGTDYDFAVARYTSVGGLDTAFGPGGTVRTGIGTGDDIATGLAIQLFDSSDPKKNKIVVAGSTYNATHSDFALAIYDDLGKLDAGAEMGGKITTPVGSGDDAVFAVAVQSNNKIVVAGDSKSGSALDFAMVRYTATGLVDATFGVNGKVVSSFGSGDDSIRAMGISNNHIFVAGLTHTPITGGTRQDVALARYNLTAETLTPPQTLPSDFDVKVTTRIGTGDSLALALAIQPDSKILIAGRAFNGVDTDFALARFDDNWSLDSGLTFPFGTAGKTTTDFGNGADTARAIVIWDGKILAAGETFTNNNLDLALARYKTDGTLDATFKTGGKQTFNFEKSSAQAQTLAIQADGKIIVAGDSFDGDLFTFTLVRYGINGEIDPSFGENGSLATFLNGAAGGRIVIQPDGKILAAGTFYQDGDNDFALARYHPDGTFDSSFGPPNHGWAIVGFTQNGNSSQDFVGALALQPDGKIVVAGSTSAGNNDDFAMIRFNADGTLDPSFGTNGGTVTAFGSGDDVVNAIALQPDGKILLIGRSVNGSVNHFALARYNADGRLDDSFGTAGRVLTPVGSSGSGVATAVQIQPDGKIVAGGYAFNNNTYDFAMVRYNSNGSLDSAFDKDGKVTTPMENRNDGIYDLALQADGKIVAAGYSNVLNSDFAIARYNADGTLDPSFGQNGKRVLKSGGSTDFIFDIALQSDGKIAVAGSALNGTRYEFVLARFWP